MSTPPSALPRREIDFAFDPIAIPRDWYRSDPFLSTFCNSLSALFPEGERFFIDSVKQLRHLIPELASVEPRPPLVGDPALGERVAGFIGQEAMHGREHRAFNDMLAGQGYTAAPRADRRLRRALARARRFLSPRSQLAVTCALEHFTAIMAEALLRRAGLRDGMHPAVQPLWLWHAVEESEHRSVAFDVYRATGGGALRRILVMVPISLLFAAQVAAAQASFLAERGVLWRPWRWLRGIAHLWLWPGHLTRLLPAYLAYYRPGFHPDQRDTRALLDGWRERLFGDAGSLRARMRRAPAVEPGGRAGAGAAISTGAA